MLMQHQSNQSRYIKEKVSETETNKVLEKMNETLKWH